MIFDWDETKAASKLRKHGITFEYATNVFNDPYAVFEQDRVEGNEIRWRALGLVAGIELLVVAHTVTEADGNETIRIISARRGNREEKKRYGQNR